MKPPDAFMKLLAKLLEGEDADPEPPIDDLPYVDHEPGALQEWQLKPRIPLLDSENPKVCWLIESARHHQRIEITYFGGSNPGARRIISPGFVFSLKDDDWIYVAGYCHLRQEERVFRVDRLLPFFRVQPKT